MPVSSSSVEGRTSVKGGASRWMGRRRSASTGPLPSIGSPTTLNMRPSVASPTGIVIGAPVFQASIPREMPSVAESAMQRATPPPVCCTVSSTTVRSGRRISMALYSSGSSSGAKRISTTGPITFLTSPLCTLTLL